MKNWKSIQSIEDLDQLISESYHSPQIIFKHSTRCNISGFVKNRLQKQDQQSDNGMTIHYLDLIQFRDISNLIAERFDVIHESPQLLVISDGNCTFHTSHLDVSLDVLDEIRMARKG